MLAQGLRAGTDEIGRQRQPRATRFKVRRVQRAVFEHLRQIRLEQCGDVRCFGETARHVLGHTPPHGAVRNSRAFRGRRRFHAGRRRGLRGGMPSHISGGHAAVASRTVNRSGGNGMFTH